MTCKYPDCKKTELNKWGMCEQHKGKYSAYRASGLGRPFNLEYIQDGLKKLAEEAKEKSKKRYYEKSVTKQDLKRELF